MTPDFATAIIPNTGLNPQYHSAKDFLSELADEYGIANIVQLTGYSQSSLVLKIGAEYGIPTTTFNAWFLYWSLSASESDYIKSHQDMFKDYRKRSDETVFFNDFNNPELFGYEHGTIRWFEGDSHNVKSWRFVDDRPGDKADIDYYVKRGIFVPGMTEEQIRIVAEKKVAQAKEHREKYEKEKGTDIAISKEVLDLLDINFYISYYRRYFADYSYGFDRDLSGKVGKSEEGDDDNNRFVGGDDRDKLEGRGGNDQLEGGKKADDLYGDEGADNLKGGDGDDLLDGGKDNDWLEGGKDNDVYLWRKGDGKDFVTDEHGENRIILEGLTEKNIEGTIARGGYATLRIKKTDDMMSFIDFISNTKARNYILRYKDGREIHLADDKDTPFRKLVGTDDKDNFRAFLDDTTIHGKAGDDELSSDKKNTRLYGDEGNDKLEVRGDGKNRLYGGAGDDRLRATKGENLLDGGQGKDELTGGDGNDHLKGGDGNDRLQGGSSDDTYDGGQGDDRMEDWKGNDTYLYGIDTGNDYVSDSDGKNTIKIAPVLDLTDLYVRQVGMWDGELRNQKSSSVMTISGLHYYYDKRWERFQIELADGRIIDGTANDSPLRRVIGSDGDDKVRAVLTTGKNYLTAHGGNDDIWTQDSEDTVDGGDGDDIIGTSGGNDTLIGGLGNDTMKGGRGDDTYVLDESDGLDSIDDWEGQNTIQVSVNILPEEVYARTYNGKGYFSLFTTKSASETRVVTRYDIWQHFSLKQADGTVIDKNSDQSPFRRQLGTEASDLSEHSGRFPIGAWWCGLSLWSIR